jgi:hypothetical protein
MAGMEHEERFPPTMLGAGYGFRKETIAGMSSNGRDAPTAGIKARVLFIRADHLLGRVRIEPDDRPCSAGVVVGEDATGARWYTVKRHAGFGVGARDRTAAASATQIG